MTAYTQVARNLRKSNGLTQQQVADYLHIDRSTYAYYESGRTKMSVEILLRLAEFFQVSLMFLLGRDEKAPFRLADGTGEDAAYTLTVNDAIARFGQLNQEEQHLVLLYRSGTPAQRSGILRFALETTEEAAD
jgi:transcriptional regulator with XRE-family HTH domain